MRVRQEERVSSNALAGHKNDIRQPPYCEESTGFDQYRYKPGVERCVELAHDRLDLFSHEVYPERYGDRNENVEGDTKRIEGLTVD